MTAELPAPVLADPFLREDGTRVGTAGEWRRRRRELRERIVGVEYGGLPATPPRTRWEELHTAVVRHLSGARLISGRVVAEFERPFGSFGFMLQLLVPPGGGPLPVVLTGDACWRYATDTVAKEILRRGNVLAQFNRVEIAADTSRRERAGGLYAACPDTGFGALAAWAWGYHRCIDALAELDFIDPARIAVVGHSRGGKAALLAGATDERIAFTSANDSGAGGAGCFGWQGRGAETLAELLRVFPHWFGARLQDYVGREAELPFDQHFLKALIAPRALLTTEAFGDAWANPTGTWQTHRAAAEVFRFLGAAEQIGIRYRNGGHDHRTTDWIAFLDFFDWRLRGKAPAQRFDANPYQPLPPAHSWKAPPMNDTMTIRAESPDDHAAIERINIDAFANHPFSRQTEHLIVDALRDARALTLSLVAEDGDGVVGHIAFSPALIDGKDLKWFMVGPLAVRPARQSEGIGSQLVRAGVEALRQLGANGCILVGPPGYYQRFGFRHSQALSFEGVPPEVFLCLPLRGEIRQGVATHHPAFFAGL